MSHWVFAYGSLLWNPGFSFAERTPARVRGYHRSLCILSHVHRGTPESPGLVLGLDRGGACNGVAYGVLPEEWPETLAYLRRREQVTAIYREVRLQVELKDGRRVGAVAYVVDRSHPQYAGRLPAERIEALVRQGHGRSGDNATYVLSTHAHLVEMGVRDQTLDRLAAALRPGPRYG